MEGKSGAKKELKLPLAQPALPLSEPWSHTLPKMVLVHALSQGGTGSVGPCPGFSTLSIRVRGSEGGGEEKSGTHRFGSRI